MDAAVMEGPLFLQSQRFGTKRWRKTWAVLYPASPHGVARLEFFDHKGPSGGGGRGGSRRLDCKVIRLAECVSVAPVAVDSPPEPGASAFRLDTAQRSHLLAADAPSSVAWVQSLCRNAFPKGSWAQVPAQNPPKLSALEMLENSLYSPTWAGHVLFRGWPPLSLWPWNLHLPDSTRKRHLSGSGDRYTSAEGPGKGRAGTGRAPRRRSGGGEVEFPHGPPGAPGQPSSLVC
ncbi:docking protein 1 isoform X2 [Sorex araneus]|uniref:docking protein 1 isoform X2 n=1 Tax=Sorex araneus TaxID=42254 RepID=UPI002433C45B|nr:docking protein 1 isoform X2 [Sorex araneus]